MSTVEGYLESPFTSQLSVSSAGDRSSSGTLRPFLRGPAYLVGRVARLVRFDLAADGIVQVYASDSGQPDCVDQYVRDFIREGFT